MKALVFLGSSLEDLRNFPDAVRKDAGFQLYAVQRGQIPTDWKPMSVVGPGVMEIRIRIQGEWRILYVAKTDSAVYVLHAFRKKSRKTSKRDIELAKRRLSETGKPR
jgi:phage-related protein